MIVAGLDGDFKRNQFGPLINLIPMAEKIKKMSAVCFVCGEDASFTERIKFSISVDKTEQVAVGGSEMYKPVCRTCYMHHNGNNAPLYENEGHAVVARLSHTVSPMKDGSASNDETMFTSSSYGGCSSQPHLPQ